MSREEQQRALDLLVDRVFREGAFEVDRGDACAHGVGGVDTYTRAHFEEARAWISKSLEAGVQAER